MFHKQHGRPRDDFCTCSGFPTQCGSVPNENQQAAGFLGNHRSMRQSERKNQLGNMDCWVLPCSSLKACVQMRSAKGQKAIDFIFFPLICMSTVTGWDGSSLWMPVSHCSFQDASQCVWTKVRTGASYRKSAHGAFGTITVLRDEQGSSCKEERSKLATAKIQKQNSGKIGWINVESSWK